MNSEKIKATHLEREACVYVRQSTAYQVADFQHHVIDDIHAYNGFGGDDAKPSRDRNV